MDDKEIGIADIERCQKVILEFMPAPVTKNQRETLRKYETGKHPEVLADTIEGGDYEQCLCFLIVANENSSLAIESLQSAAESAIKYAGVGDGSELYAKLSKILPDYFNEAGLQDGVEGRLDNLEQAS